MFALLETMFVRFNVEFVCSQLLNESNRSFHSTWLYCPVPGILLRADLHPRIQDARFCPLLTQL